MVVAGVKSYKVHMQKQGEDSLVVNLTIAGISMDLSAAPSLSINKKLKLFQTGVKQEADCKIDIVREEIKALNSPILMKDQDITWSYRGENQRGYAVTIHDIGTCESLLQLQADGEWSKARFLYADHKSDLMEGFTGPLGEILFRNRILYHRGIVLHAAAIAWREKGILFSAPSGTGKSTQAKLWKRYMGAELINEDRPAVRMSANNQAYVYGTPWNGSSPRCNNRSAPLSAIVLLEQASENSIRRMNVGEGIARLMPRCFLPYYDEKQMKQAIHNLENIIAATPVYLLCCKPDRNAVEMVYQCVK